MDKGGVHEGWVKRERDAPDGRDGVGAYRVRNGCGGGQLWLESMEEGILASAMVRH